MSDRGVRDRLTTATDAAAVTLAAVALAVFAVIAWLRTQRPAQIAPVDVRIHDAALTFAADQPWLTTASEALAFVGGAIAFAVAVSAIGWLAWTRRFGAALFVAACAGGGWLIARGAKAFFELPRPADTGTGSFPETTSFPSGHAMASVYVYVALALLTCLIVSRRAWPLLAAALLLAVAIGTSRVLLGYHWASDVAAGWALAGALVAICVAVSLRLTPSPEATVAEGPIDGQIRGPAEHDGPHG